MSRETAAGILTGAPVKKISSFVTDFTKEASEKLAEKRKEREAQEERDRIAIAASNARIARGQRGRQSTIITSLLPEDQPDTLGGV